MFNALHPTSSQTRVSVFHDKRCNWLLRWQGYCNRYVDELNDNESSMCHASKSSQEASYIFSYSCWSNSFALSCSTRFSCNITHKKEAHNGYSLSSILYIPRMASIFFAPLALRHSSPGGSIHQAFYRKSMNKLLTTFKEVFIVFCTFLHKRGIKVTVD